MKFRDLEHKLVKWYQREKRSTQQLAEKEFEDANISPGDSLVIFALRLERLAGRAFVCSKKER